MKDGFTGERSIVLPPMTIETERQDPLVSSLYITDIGYYPHAEGHYRERRKPIDEYVLIYCIEGKGWYEVRGKRFEVKGNQFFVLPAGEAHTYAADKLQPWTIYWIHFTGDHAPVYSEGLIAPHDIRPSMNSRINERQHIFEEIFYTLDRSTDRESLRYASSLLHYYLATMRYLYHYRATTSSTTGDGHEETDIVSAAQHFMEENIERRLTLNQLAQYTGYSPSYFSQLFREQTGESPLARFNRMKIELACKLLKTTNMRVNQICHKVGIDDSYYFSRLFKQLTGYSPRQYRDL